MDKAAGLQRVILNTEGHTARSDQLNSRPCLALQRSFWSVRLRLETRATGSDAIPSLRQKMCICCHMAFIGFFLFDDETRQSAGLQSLKLSRKPNKWTNGRAHGSLLHCCGSFLFGYTLYVQHIGIQSAPRCCNEHGVIPNELFGRTAERPV